MADTTDPTTPLVTTAASATVANDSSQELLMRLRNGARHETVAGQPEQYNISTFDFTDLPLIAGQQNEAHLGRMDTAIYALPMANCGHVPSVRMANGSRSSCTSDSPIPRLAWC